MDIIETIRLLNEGRRNLLDVSLRFVQHEIHTHLKDVARIHLLSAEQAFISASTSNASDLEIRVGIGHLRDAFNSYQVLLEKGNLILGFLCWEWNDVVKTSIYLKLASISGVISLIYKKINDEANYVSWKITAMNTAEQYLTKRPYAIRKWENATMTEFVGCHGAHHSVPNWEKREKHKEELAFISLFSEVIKKEI